MIVVTPAGDTIELGTVETGATIGIVDYSRLDTDAFGITTVVKRAFARRMALRLAVPIDAVDGLQRRLAELRATSATWIADSRFQAMSLRGFYKDFSLDLATSTIGYCSLTVESLTGTDTVADTGTDPSPDDQPSTLQLLQPLAITDATLVATTVSEDDHPELSPAATQAMGARVIKAATHRVYESAAAGNVGIDPAGGTGAWIDIGTTRRWAMFDQALGSVTSAARKIVVTLAPGAPVSALAALDVTGATIRVQSPGYDRTQDITSATALFLDMPLPSDSITVTIEGPAEVSIGTLLIGRLVGLGITEAGPSAGITDYSRKVVDDFGDVTIVERAFAKRMTARALIRTDALDDVAGRIAAVRAQPSLWIGQAGMDSLTIYGFFKDFSIEVGDTLSKVSLSIEGLAKTTQVAPLKAISDWPSIGDPDGTKPADNADRTSENTSKDTAAVGGRPATEVLDQLLAVDRAVKDAGDRITVARQNAEKAAADANARIDAADRILDEAVRDFAAEVERAQGVDEALTRRIDSIVAEGGYDDRDVRALISSEATVRADDDRALGRRVDTVSASLKEGDDAVRADVKVTTDALARRDEAFAEQARLIEASLGTVDNRIAAKAQEITTAYADADRALARRIDSIVAEGGYDDRDVRAEIIRVDQTAIDRDVAIGRSIERVESKSAAGNIVRKATFEDGKPGAWPVGPYESRVIRPADFGQPAPPFGDYVYLMRGLRDVLEGDVWIKGAWGGRKLRVTGYASSQFSSADSAVGVFARAANGRIDFPAIRAASAGVAGYSRFDGVIGLASDIVEVLPWLQNNVPPGTESAEVRLHSLSITDATQAQENAARIEERYDTLAGTDRALAEQARLIEASLGTVDTRIAASATDVTSAFTRADLALSGRSTVLEASAANVSTGVVRNDTFNVWTHPQPMPAGWAVWAAQGNFSIERGAPGRVGQFYVRTRNDVPNVESGFFQTVGTAGPGKWIAEVTVASEAGGLSGAGVTLHGVWNIDFCGDPDTNGRIGNSADGEVRTWSKTFDLDGRDQINVHAMLGWTGFGRTIVPKYLTWHRLSLRPADDGDIKAGKADAALNAPGGVLARLTATDNTLADLPNRYATAQSVQTLEAQVNFAADSGLQRTINARIEDRATVIADSKAGAVAETVRVLRGEYNGTVGEVREQRGVINGLNGKTAAYIRLIADAGGGVAALSLWSDQYGGAWELSGNGRIRGNLLVDGTVTTEGLVGNAVTAPYINQTSARLEASSYFDAVPDDAEPITGWQEVISVGVATRGSGAAVMVSPSVAFDYGASADAGYAPYMKFALFRDGLMVWGPSELTAAQSYSGVLSFSTQDMPSINGTTVYQLMLKIQHVQGAIRSRGYFVANFRTIAATLFKR